MKLTKLEHSGILSDFGKEIYYRMLRQACEKVGVEFCGLKYMESVEVK